MKVERVRDWAAVSSPFKATMRRQKYWNLRLLFHGREVVGPPYGSGSHFPIEDLGFTLFGSWQA